MTPRRCKRWTPIAAAWMAFALASTPAAVYAEVTSGSPDPEKTESIVINIEPLTVPILNDNVIRGQALVELRLVVRDPESWHAAVAMMPRLRDLYLRRFYRYSSSAYWDGNRLDLDRVKKSFQKVTDQVLGPEVASVLIYQARLFERR